MSFPPDQQPAWDDFVYRWSIYRIVPELVDEKFEDGREYASSAYRTAQETIERLSNLAQNLQAIDVNVATTIGDITPPTLSDFLATAPTSPSISLNLPSDLSDTLDMESALHDKIISDILNGGPAISDEVETAIFERERERSLMIHQDALDSISAEWSRRGFTLPDGMLKSGIEQAVIEYGNKRLDISRDIAIKNFELSDANTKFAIEKGILWIANRIETYKAKISAEISRIDAIIKKYLGEVEVYKGSAIVYNTLTDVQIKKFDAELRMALARAELIVKDAEIDMKNYEVLNALRIEAMKAVSGVAAQMVAGALSSVNASVHMSASNASNYSYATQASGDTNG